MRRSALALVVLLGAAFLFLSVAKRRGPDGTPNRPTATLDTADRQRIQQFWDRYREATTLRIEGKIADAAQAYVRALELNPSHEDALYYLGNMQFELGESAEAERAWLRLIEVNDLTGAIESLEKIIKELDLTIKEQFDKVKYNMQEGTLMILLVDRKLNKTVWQGYNSGLIDINTMENERFIKGSVRLIFDKYRVFADGYLKERS